METKRLDFSKNKFEANGHTYHYSQTLSIARFEEFERLQVHVGFGKDFKNMYDKLKEAYEAMNKNKLADAAVIVSNLVNGLAQNLEKRDHPALQMCALFINREEEDASKFDEDLMKEKIEDWKTEGYAVKDFFQLAFNFVTGFIDAYEEIIQDISDRTEQMTEKKNTGKSE